MVTFKCSSEFATFLSQRRLLKVHLSLRRFYRSGDADIEFIDDRLPGPDPPGTIPNGL
jgi:hypothetical protein